MATIQTEGLTYRYGIGTPFEKTAVDHVDLEIEAGSFVGIIGQYRLRQIHTHSAPERAAASHRGKVLLDGRGTSGQTKSKKCGGYAVSGRTWRSSIRSIRSSRKPWRKTSPLVRGNMGLAEEEVQARVRETAAIVGLSEEILKQSPFLLSGGQKRRVAIAGVMAMRPEVLILDEPTAGLDPRGREEILQEIQAYRNQTGATILLVSHSMEDVARHAKKILVMNAGKVFCYDTVANVFRRSAGIAGDRSGSAADHPRL